MTEIKEEVDLSKTDVSDQVYLRNIGKIENHLSKFTLQLINPDLENEWRISQVLSRQYLIYVAIIGCLIRDGFYLYMFATTESLPGTILRFALVFLMLLTAILIARKKSAYHTKKYDLSNHWSQTQYKMDQQDEAKRLYILYILWYLAIYIHQALADAQ